MSVRFRATPHRHLSGSGDCSRPAARRRGSPSLAAGHKPGPHLARKGTLVIVGGEGGGKWTGIGRQIRALALSPFLRQRLTTFVSKHRLADLEALSRFIEAGQVAPIIDRTYPLAEVSDAMRHLEAGGARGKIAITI